MSSAIGFRLETRVCGIPCYAEVTSYSPYMPMRITGTGFGDADPPEYEEVEFQLLDRKGYPAKWLESIADKRLGDDWRTDIESEISRAIAHKEHEFDDY